MIANTVTKTKNLYIPTMQHNLMRTFLMKEGGVIMNDITKIHCKDPTSVDHCIHLKGII